MPNLRAGDWVYDQGEQPAVAKDVSVKAENKPGHRPLGSYNLPKWVYHPEKPGTRSLIEKRDYFGMAADGNRNYAGWNVAHVAAYHDDLKMLSLATFEQCMEKNKFGMTPTHMCGMGQHPYGPSLHVLYELVQMGVAEMEAVNNADQTPWHVCQRMHRPVNLKKYEKVLLKGAKPDGHDKARETQLQVRGKFARPQRLEAEAALGLEDSEPPLPVALLFPGQGSQYVGMMKDLKDIPAVQQMLSKAKGILGYDVLDVMLEGPEDKLQRTIYCQPAMYIAGLAAAERLREEEPEQVERCMAVAGLSLGEYTALTLAGVFSFEVGLRLVKARASAMDEEVTGPGARAQGMVSVAGLKLDVVEKLCKEAAAMDGDNGVCQVANFLFPNGFSCAGTEKAVQELRTLADGAGALQAKLIKAGGAFHTPMMAGAKGKLLKELESVKNEMQPPRCRVYMNNTAKSVGPASSVDEIIALLGEQLVTPVRWSQSMEQAIKDGCTQFIECGPSKQLKAMMKRISPKANEKMTNVLA